MGKRRVLILLAALALAGALLFTLFGPGREGESRTIPVSGTIEATTVDVAFKIPGKIDLLPVEEGDLLKEGQLIATLENRDLLAQEARARAALETAESRIPTLLKNIEFQEQSSTQEIEQARSAVEAARARMDQLLTGARPQEIQAAGAEVDLARADLEKRQADMERAERLYQARYISAQDWDTARTTYEMAAARLRQAEEHYDLVREGPRAEEIAATRAQLRQAQAAFRLAQTRTVQVEALRRELATARAQVKEAASALQVVRSQTAYTRLVAPLSGVVLVKNAEAGEFVAPGAAVITLGMIEKPWLKAFIMESDLGRIKLDQRASVSTDSYPGKVYPGRITFISSEAEFTPKNVQTAKERVKLVYRIKISLVNPQGELKPGMPGDALIHLE